MVSNGVIGCNAKMLIYCVVVGVVLKSYCLFGKGGQPRKGTAGLRRLWYSIYRLFRYFGYEQNGSGYS